MKSVSNTIQIDASSAKVWEITMDWERWPEWMPHFKEIRRVDQGLQKLGSSAYIKQTGLPKAEWIVDGLNPGNFFAWSTQIGFLRLRGMHTLEQLAPGKSTCELSVEAYGFFTELLWPLIGPQIERSLKLENECLKRHAEKFR